MRLQIGVDKHAVSILPSQSLQWQSDQIAKPAAGHRVLARKQPVVGFEADFRAPIHRLRQQHRAKAPCLGRRDRLCKEQPDVTALAGARPFECCRSIDLTARCHEGEGVGRPPLAVEVHGQKLA
ncbi:MAG TPA: hypothetical protein VG758_05985, partial [Hyphomicrobiaceae bacterium]|nr:hypothetical protein [Hyphomicrobiaceae bacterium]